MTIPSDAPRAPVPGSGTRPGDEAGEQQLIERLRHGEGDAYRVLVQDFGPQMLATARRILGSEEDARDALQDAFTAVFRAIATFEGKSRLATWLHRVIANTALMKLRNRRSRPEYAIEDLLPRFSADGHHLEPPCPFSGRAEFELERAERRAMVRHAIDRLPPAYREVILFRDIEELSTEETGRLLGITPNAVKIRLHRARQALRTLLQRHIEDCQP